MVGRGPIKRKPHEPFKRWTIIDLFFQFRIGIDPKPLLQQHAFKPYHGRVCISTFATGTHRIMVQQDAFNPGPVNRGIQFRHEFKTAIEGAFQSQVCETQGAVEFFVSHGILQVVEYWRCFDTMKILKLLKTIR